jgi:polyisoprenoid-binding protein YceI
MFGKLMVASILLHIAGGLKHQFIDKDATLRRMWFTRGEMPIVGALISKNSARIVAALAFVAAAGAAYGLGFFERHEANVQATALKDIASDWVVQDGDITIVITQFGNEVTGTFADWTSEISFDPYPADIMGSVTTTVAIGSLTLGSVSANAVGADYFDLETHPTAIFTADIKPDGDGFVADGTLTIKGTSVAVKMPFDLILEGETATMTGAIPLNRQDFKVGESQADEGTLGFTVAVAIALTAQTSE